MELIFRLNKDYVFFHALNMTQNEEPFFGWGNFTNKIWEESPEIFYFLAGAPEYVLYFSLDEEKKELYKKANEKLKNLRKTPEYKRLIKETEVYFLFVKKQWEKNRDNVLSFLRETCKATIPENSISVFITHPKLKNGMAIDKKTIAWGHSEDFKNYSTVYLCHEILHILTDFDNSEITHAVIEIAADNELRMKLNKKGKYFEYPGHLLLRKTEKKILPYWKKYLTKKEKNINNFIDELKNRANFLS